MGMDWFCLIRERMPKEAWKGGPKWDLKDSLYLSSRRLKGGSSKASVLSPKATGAHMRVWCIAPLRLNRRFLEMKKSEISFVCVVFKLNYSYK